MYRFGLPNGPLETSKTPKLAETSYEFCSFGKFHNFPFKTPPGLHLGTSWASFGRPFGVQEASEIVQESSKRPPSTPQEASKSAPFAPGSLPLADQPALGAPRGLQEASKPPRDPSWPPRDPSKRPPGRQKRLPRRLLRAPGPTAQARRNARSDQIIICS